MHMFLGFLTERKIKEQEEMREVCLWPELLVKSHICACSSCSESASDKMEANTCAPLHLTLYFISLYDG